MAQTKIEKLKSRLKEIKKELKQLEQEHVEQSCHVCEDIMEEMSYLTDEAEDVQDEIKQLKKKK